MKKPTAKILLQITALVMGCQATTASAAFLSEDFDDVPGLTGSGWSNINHSTSVGAFNWFQGSDNVFSSEQTTGYAGANFNATTGANTISLWLISPTLTYSNGDTISFYTRTVDTPEFADRLEIRLSTNGSSEEIGTSATDVGDFATLLLTVNPSLSTIDYPSEYTLYTATISGLLAPTSGRMAFRYFVTDGGPDGNNSDYIGVDTLRITPAPEPSTFVMLGVASAFGLVRLCRTKRQA